ncbi:hypothetical protein MY5147_001372 [Beauveria neobassiana]
MRLSGLQKEVLALYRHCLRESRKKPETTRPHFQAFARYMSPEHRRTTGRRHHAQVDGANDPLGSSKRASVDSALVDAITRNIVQQLRAASVGQYGRHRTNTNAPVDRPGLSRTSSQQEAVDRFTSDLRQYAKSRTRKETTIPTKQSAPTLRTVSALMPFRSEFELASLAVTSKEQANRIDSYITQAVEARAPPEAGPSGKPYHRKPALGGPSQVDGFDDTGPSDSPNTEISFAPSNGMDEWRYAMIDEVPKKKKKDKTNTRQRTKRHCLHCFDHSPSTATEEGRAPPRKLATAPVPKFHGGIGPPPPVPPPPVPPRRPPRPKVGLFDVEPARGPSASQEIPSSENHAVSPKMLPSRPGNKDKEKAPDIARRRSPHPRAVVAQRGASPKKKKRSSPKRRIPHENTSKQYDRTLHQATPIDLKAAVEEAMNGQKSDKITSSRRPELRDDLADHISICCRSSRGVPSRANARPNIPRRTSSMSQFMFSSEIDFDDREITDRDVLRGLHIAASAACDEEVDAFVRNQTGLRIRRFLADLMTLETLAVNPPVDKKQWARQRRADMRRLKQQMRRSYEINRIGQAKHL